MTFDRTVDELVKDWFPAVDQVGRTGGLRDWVTLIENVVQRRGTKFGQAKGGHDDVGLGGGREGGHTPEFTFAENAERLLGSESMGEGWRGG